jgi:hypothetical protein
MLDNDPVVQVERRSPWGSVFFASMLYASRPCSVADLVRVSRESGHTCTNADAARWLVQGLSSGRVERADALRPSRFRLSDKPWQTRCGQLHRGVPSNWAAACQLCAARFMRWDEALAHLIEAHRHTGTADQAYALLKRL